MTCSGPISPRSCCSELLARRLPAGAAAVVGAYRDVDPALSPVLAALAARTPVLPLTGLTVEAVTELIGDVLGQERARDVAADVHRRTGGNPFFAQQVSWLLKDGREGVPPGVREALEQRFAALPDACTAALRAAAVAGPRFPVDLVARAAGQPPEAMAGSLAEAARARVLGQGGPGRYRFVHDLFREYAYHELPRPATGPGCTSGSAWSSRPSGPAAVMSPWASSPGTSCRPIPARRGRTATAWRRPGRRPAGWPTKRP